MHLKNISEQTIVITGATSGIGLVTARTAAKMGARVILIARNEDALRELTDEINAGGRNQAVYAAADVADETALRQAADKAIAHFGGFDTWVNNAGGSVYGRIMQVPTADLRRLFETNVWGVVNGSRIAVEHLKNKGGALINVGSEVSDAPVPLQGMYSSSKHAVKGFTDALRIEVEADGFPISVTLIKPTAIHTPFSENAKNYLPYEPQLPPPVYAPELVAEAIIHCAQNRVRDFFVGGMAKAHSSMALNAPRIFEKMNASMIDSMQNSGEPARGDRPDGLYETNSNLRERGAGDRFVMETSIYQKAEMHPFVTAALVIGAGLGLAAFLSSRKSRSSAEDTRYLAGGRFTHSDIREKMEVVGSDNIAVGVIDRVVRGDIKLTRNDSPDGKHHLIPLNLVESVTGGKVRLAQTAEETRQSWVTVESKPRQTSGDEQGRAAGI